MLVPRFYVLRLLALYEFGHSDAEFVIDHDNLTAGNEVIVQQNTEEDTSQLGIE